MTRSATEPLTVLVVDDDSALARTLADILRLEGYEPRTAASGEQGLDVARTMSDSLALALIDLRLPDMTGLDLINRLREVSASTQVVILTGNASVDSAIGAMREQSLDYLVKPVAPDQLLRSVAVAGERWQRKMAEEALRKTSERFARVFESVSEIIAIVGADRTIQFASPSVESVLGHDPVSLVGMSVYELVAPEDTARVQQLMNGRMSPTTAFEVKARHKDDSFRILEVVANTFGEHGEGEVVLTARDITERRQLENQYRQSQKMEAVGRLASGVAHDFNNVLTAIAGFSDLLLEDLPGDDPRREDVAEIRRAVDRGAALSRQLLAFSRQQVLSPQLVNLDALISDMSAMLRRVLGEDIELRFIPCDHDCIVSADPGQLEQVLLNLAVNARDAMPDGGKLTIEVGRVDLDASYAEQHFPVEPGPYVQLSVSDTGLGMDEKTKAHIFEPFFTTKEKGKGTGLRLSTVYGIVKQSGGYVWVYSEPGQGATFKVYLPRVTADKGRKPRVTPAPNRLPRGSETILLAEDEATVRAVVRQALERQGYVVLEAPNTETAIAFAERHDGAIHMLISDVVMPGLSGRDLADRVRTARPGIKVMFMSGYTDEAVVRHGKLDAGVAYLQKPFGPEALARKVREVLS